MNGELPEGLREDFMFDNVVDKIERIRFEIDECSQNPTEENKKRKDELVWAQFMAGLKLCSGNLFF